MDDLRETIRDHFLHNKSLMLEGDPDEIYDLVEEVVTEEARRHCSWISLPVVWRVHLPECEPRPLPVTANRKLFSAKGVVVVAGPEDQVREVVKTRSLGGERLLKFWSIVGVVERGS